MEQNEKNYERRYSFRVDSAIKAIDDFLNEPSKNQQQPTV
jgi:hypothetical protein